MSYVSRQPYIDEREERGGDIGDGTWDRESQNLAIDLVAQLWILYLSVHLSL